MLAVDEVKSAGFLEKFHGRFFHYDMSGFFVDA